MTMLKKILVSGFGLGLMKPAPGSWGTAGPAALFWLLLVLNVPATAWSVGAIVFALVFSVLLIALGDFAIAHFADEDPGQVVLDEFAGFALAVAFVPVPAWCSAHGAWGLFAFVAGMYILFRATDTLKLPPARQLEKLPRAWGILCDDLMAGVQANLIAQIVIRVWLL